MLRGAAGLSAPKLTILRMSSDRIHLYTDIERWKHYSNKYNNKKKIHFNSYSQRNKRKNQENVDKYRLNPYKENGKNLFMGFVPPFIPLHWY